MILYHVTDIENLGSIEETGLVPGIGRLSHKFGEDEERLYFFHDVEDLENALLNWLGEEFDVIDAEDGYEHQHVVLECLFPDGMSVSPDLYEIAIAEAVEPNRIRISRDIFVDFDYDDDFIAGYPGLATWDAF